MARRCRTLLFPFCLFLLIASSSSLFLCFNPYFSGLNPGRCYHSFPAWLLATVSSTTPPAAPHRDTDGSDLSAGRSRRSIDFEPLTSSPSFRGLTADLRSRQRDRRLSSLCLIRLTNFISLCQFLLLVRTSCYGHRVTPSLLWALSDRVLIESHSLLSPKLVS